MTNIQAICFDADGVVVSPQMQFAKHLAEHHAILPEMTRPFFRGIFSECMMGKAALSEVLLDYLQDWKWQGTVDEFIAAWLHYDDVIDTRLIHHIQQLHQAGMICCLATNQERNRAEYMKSKMDFQKCFDHLFFSCEVGSLKPDPSYFAHIETVLKLEKESLLFWDDAETNVKAAQARGWKAELYTDFETFERIMEEYR
ncbi:MAG: HAD-IA family hydrolase [Caldilineaceae bacterium]